MYYYGPSYVIVAKKTMQSLLKDVTEWCKKEPLLSKALWEHRNCCSAASHAVAKCTLHEVGK